MYLTSSARTVPWIIPTVHSYLTSYLFSQHEWICSIFAGLTNHDLLALREREGEREMLTGRKIYKISINNLTNKTTN
jgi:hypothetical protein